MPKTTQKRTSRSRTRKAELAKKGKYKKAMLIRGVTGVSGILLAGTLGYLARDALKNLKNANLSRVERMKETNKLKNKALLELAKVNGQLNNPNITPDNQRILLSKQSELKKYIEVFETDLAKSRTWKEYFFGFM